MIPGTYSTCIPYGNSMESIWKRMESIWKTHGIHLKCLQSTPHSMDSIWNNPGRVDYWFYSSLIPVISGPIPVDSSRFLQEWEGHCKVLENKEHKGQRGIQQRWR